MEMNMKPLSKDEVADIMKKTVPRLLHKRIAELEGQLESVVVTCELYIDTYEGSSVERVIREAREVLEKEII